MSDNNIGEWWRARSAEHELHARLLAQCEAPGGLKQLRASAVAEYRCATKGCLLLLVWRTPVGLMFYQPAYRLASDYNGAQSTEAARAKNTFDGERHWKPQAGKLDGRYRDLPNGGGLLLNCGHGGQLVSGDELLDRAQAATPGKPYRKLV